MKLDRIGIPTLLVVGMIVGAAVGRSSASWFPVNEARSQLPNVDFHTMAIATQPVDAVESGGILKVRVKAWARCALGVTTCDARPRNVEAICLGSGRTITIGEAAWPAFKRIPDEDLPGLTALPLDMDLCRSGHQAR